MSGETILVIDDEEDILELVRYNLASDGFKVECAATGEEALKRSAAMKPDLILLDLMLPGINGLDVAKKLKFDSRTTSIPIIMLTAKGEEADIVTGLELGADDYITKPFSPRVLIARIKAVLRREAHAPEGHSDVIRAHDLLIHPGRREVMADSKYIQLTYTEFQVLHHLARRPGWVSTRSQIVDALRGEGYPVTDRSVDVQIVGLRKKLGPYGKYIETVRGVGYRFAEKP